jgi:hypothetical protein
MGLLFGKKSSDGNVISSKKVSDHDIDRKDILEISRKLGFTRTGARQEFQKIIDKAQTGGVTREEVHEGLQRMILDGHLTKDQAHRMARELGLERKDFTRFEDISESWDHQKSDGEETAEKHSEFGKNALKEKLDSSGRRVGNNSGFSDATAEGDHSSANNKSAVKDKPTSIWNILNSRKN